MTARVGKSKASREKPQAFVARIRSILNDLSVTERRLADFVLDFPGEFASYSATELAKLAQVSNATITRFIRRLGYDSFNEARKHVRAEKTTGSPLFLSVSASGDASSIATHLQHSQANLIATFNRLSDAEINKISKAIVDANQVWVVGYRSSRSFASYFRWQIIQVVERVHLIPGGGETLAENLASMTGRDCLIVFAVRRRTAQVARIIDYANKTGMKIVYVCDQQFTESVKADWLIRCDAYAPGPLDNHVAVVAVCDLLITNIFQAAGAAGRKRLTAIEAAHDVTREL